MLLVDAGNTRIKWARLDGEQPGRAQAAAHAGWRVTDYARHLFGRRPEDLLVSCVAGAAVQRALRQTARRAGVTVTFVRVPRAGGGVRVGYRDPWRLGVDRFTGLVGAVSLLGATAVCVAGVGTALTLDLVDARGRHRGGVIVPAPDLMVQTLFRHTHGIRRRAQGGARGTRQLFARSTREAVVQGGRYAAAALIERAVQEAARLLPRPPLVVLTGGGAHAIRPLLQTPAIGVPDLVLRGLAVLARGAGQGGGPWE
jgi:type III pantothenate kinase